jgi:hypothetical protein
MNKTIKNNILSRFLNSIFILVLFSVLNACSSGGGGSAGPTVTISDVSVVEGNDLVFTITLSAAAGSNAAVNYATSDGTAVAGQDYTAASGTLSIPSGATSAAITITSTSDTDYEADETLTLALSSPVGLTLGTASSATGTITNDDNANPKGYFTGTSTVSPGLGEVTGMVYDRRLMMFSVTQNVLYDVVFTMTSETEFSGSANVYENGAVSQPGVTVTGTTNDAQISVTVSGTGLASGVFDMLYDINSNRGATIARILAPNPDDWQGSIYGQDNDNSADFSVDGSGVYYGVDFTTPNACHYTGILGLPPVDANIYFLEHDVDDTLSCLYISTAHTGFASVINGTSIDNKLVYAFANGSISVFAVMTLP